MIFAVLAAGPIPPLVPRPALVTPRAGAFRLDAKTQIVVSSATRSVGDLFRGSVAPGSGLPLNLTTNKGKGNIVLRVDSGRWDLGAEGYRLVVAPTGIEIVGNSPAGVFYGTQTLRQLLPTSTFRRSPTRRGPITLPCLEISDRPRLGWRGAMVDVSRHFMPKESILRFIDSLALHKLNTFHFHLTDDQGWRMEVKKYPRLTEVGAWHRSNELTNDPTTWKTVPEGGFYTQDDLREIVAYAKARFINVVPEIEMPGHSFAIVVAYPELGNTGKQYRLRGTNEGTDDIVNVSPEVVKFYQDVLTEVMAIFPSKFIHVGGDEVWKGYWERNPRMVAQMKELGLDNFEELQSWFILQMDTFLTKRGRRLVGWDEILEGGLAPGATVMSWRGIGGGITAAKSGQDVVMSPTSHLYLDYYQSEDRFSEPRAIGGLVTLEQTYSFDPIPAELSPTEAKHVLGAQGNLWTEYIPNAQHLEYMAFPRLCALAEVTWSPKENRKFAEFLTRLEPHLFRLDALGISYRSLQKAETAKVGGWKSGELTEKFENREWDITPHVTGPGTYDVQFQYTGGECRMDLESAEILENGESVSRDLHEGRTGSVNKDNVYSFLLDTFKPGAKYTLRARVRADGGTDSAGEIRLRKG